MQITKELHGLTKQIDLTRANVDVTRKTVEPSSSTAGSVTTLVQQALEPQPPPPPPSPRNPPDLARPAGLQVHLRDNRPPLIPIPAAVTVALMGSASSPTAFYTNGEHHKPPKHDFPRFKGTAPYLWTDRCLAYSELWVAPHNWVATAALYIDGQAAHWLQAFCQTYHDITWEAFTASLLEEFSADEYELVMHKL
ncbi:hypothetical protein D1007_40558 [Hordeum vulgare]|nr:hypothetical protein D1007_40558 [Hordeum vulgare]